MRESEPFEISFSHILLSSMDSLSLCWLQLWYAASLFLSSDFFVFFVFHLIFFYSSFLTSLSLITLIFQSLSFSLSLSPFLSTLCCKLFAFCFPFLRINNSFFPFDSFHYSPCYYEFLSTEYQEIMIRNFLWRYGVKIDCWTKFVENVVKLAGEAYKYRIYAWPEA